MEEQNFVEAQTNFTIIPNGVLNVDCSDRAFRVYAILRSFVRPGSETFPKIATLAERSGKDSRYLERGISELAEKGLLLVRKKSFNNSTKRINSYYFPNIADNHSPTNSTAPDPTHSTGSNPSDSTAPDPTNSTAPIEEEKLEEEKKKKTTGATAPEATLFPTAISEPTPAAAEMGPHGYPMNTQGIIAEWVDRSNPKPVGRMLGQMSKEVKLQFDAGHAYEDIRTGIAQVATRGLHPSTLASATHHAAQVRSGASQNMAAAAGPAKLATGTQRAMQALAAGAQLQAQYDQNNQQKALGGTASGFTADRAALGAGSADRQQDSGRGDDSGVVGNPQPFVFR